MEPRARRLHSAHIELTMLTAHGFWHDLWVGDVRDGVTVHVLYKSSHKWVVRRIQQEEAVVDLTDEQWRVVEPLIGELQRRADG